MKITEISNRPDLMEEAIQYFWKCWGSESNLPFYRDCIEHSIDKEKELPKFYVVLEDDKIIASYALVVNDIISRQDLMPWFACLFVNETHRNQGIAEKLLDHALMEAKRKGFDEVYLSTDLVNFYERKGWTLIGKGFNIFGTAIKMYSKKPH
jgi:GNAT superfamily N-acetyltransferase